MFLIGSLYHVLYYSGSLRLKKNLENFDKIRFFKIFVLENHVLELFLDFLKNLSGFPDIVYCVYTSEWFLHMSSYKLTVNWTWGWFMYHLEFRKRNTDYVLNISAGFVLLHYCIIVIFTHNNFHSTCSCFNFYNIPVLLSTLQHNKLIHFQDGKPLLQTFETVSYCGICGLKIATPWTKFKNVVEKVYTVVENEELWYLTSHHAVQ